MFFFFFFSSRRRHTRWNCDWSSDVCSSDLAREGADVAILDICGQIPCVEYAMSSDEDLGETARLIGEAGRRALPVKGDVRDHACVEAAVQQTVDELGRLDLVVANAGILPTTGEAAHSL